MLYSRFNVDWRDGLVVIECRSGTHVERGTLTPRGAIDLYTRLGAVLRRAQAAAPVCVRCAANDCGAHAAAPSD